MPLTQRSAGLASLALAESTADGLPSAAVPIVFVSTSAITLEHSALRVQLPADRTLGVVAEYKRTPADLFIAPLAQAVRQLPGAPVKTLQIAFDASTPYRVVVEVLFTLGQAEVPEFQLLTQNRGQPRVVTFHPPSAKAATTATSKYYPGFFVIVSDKGFSLKAAGGNIAPGCIGPGPGLAVPKLNGLHDFSQLRYCASRLREPNSDVSVARNVTVAATFETAFQEIVRLMDSVRTTESGEPLFGEVNFGIPR
jgi:hypothetical protein